MKLAFIHIVNHKALEEIDIPINSSHKCHYSKEKLFLQFDPSDLDYYEGLDCSAIIGKNGVGKSTILDFLEVAYEGTESSGIIVWYSSKNKKYHICSVNLYLDKDSIVSNQDVTFEENFPVFSKRHKLKLIKANNLTGVEANEFSSKRRSNSFIQDLSLSQYVNGSNKVIIERTNRLIRYLSSSPSFKQQTRPTVKFTFQFSTSSNAYLKSLLNNKDFVSENIDSKYQLEQLSDKLNDSQKELLIDDFFEIGSQLLEANIITICNYLSKLSIIRKDYRDVFFIKLLLGFINQTVNDNYIFKILAEVRGKNDIDSQANIIELDTPIIRLKFNEILATLSDISDLVNRYQHHIKLQNKNEISTFNANLIVNLTHCISKLPQLLQSNFKYGWQGFSTGEFAKLNIFSELYHYIERVGVNKNYNHIIIMDEVDLYLHPDWQRTFFLELLEFIRFEFPKNSVQLILSTHSPIIISDFLPEDIVSLDRNNGHTKVVESFGFATHITDLYLDGMHLSSTFGEHSKKAISRLLKHANTDSLTHLDHLLIKKIKSKNIQNMILGTNDQN
ncbi:AAA family ATPase [Pseudoalteromonas luteoviolacea]|uniref:AAA family ATPase n=1 Tax=Pseudoalteromonas luteoviolacea TaxID=43657 RepID=UPI001B39CA8F|nr:AAA family ATPase [Pseudoalteromonas luteoviolacea]MBQ4838701.1 AAA family ATPase [Pseudoalteromonas luteoviolacea]